MTIQDFIAKHRIRMSAEYADANPNMSGDPEWARSATHWKCELRMGRRKMTTYFSQGSAYTGEPDLASVLDCLASDAASYMNARNFDEWAADLGFDTDSRKAERTYKVSGEEVSKLQNLLGGDLDLLNQLAFKTYTDLDADDE